MYATSDLLKRGILILLLFMVAAGCSPSTSKNHAQNGKPIELTPAEQKWINEQTTILSAPDPDFPPAEFINKTGHYKGVSAEYLDLIFKRVGLKIQIVKLKKWSDVLDYAKKGKIHLVTAATKTLQRDSYLDFSNPFLEFPVVIIVRQQVNRDLTPEQLKGMKVAVVNNYAANDYIALSHPYIDLDIVPDILAGLRKVSFGMVDAMVANIASVSYYIEKESITNLKVAGNSGLTLKLCFAPRKDLPILTSILNKGLASLSYEEKHRIYSKWIRLEQSPKLTKKILFSVSITAGIVLILIMVVVGWNRSLKANVEDKTKELKKEVTKHEQAKLAIIENEEKLAAIINSTNDHILMLDETLDVVWVNNIAKNAFGNDLKNRKCFEIYAGLDQPCEDCIVKKCFNENSMQEREINLKKEDGSRINFWETANTASLNRQGFPKTIVTIFRDITHRKVLAAEAMRAGHLASIGELAAGVAHEINNPINSIINFAQIMLNEDKKRGRQNNIAERMINEGTRIAGIVGSLLVFAKDRRGGKKPLRLDNVLTETIALTQTQITQTGIKLEMDLPLNLPMVFGHSQQIQQVFLNLINNARFALAQDKTADKSFKIIKIIGCVEKKINSVRIIFEDNGIGIPDKIIDRIMEPFFTTKPGGQGTGLGLSISHGIITDHDGQINIESKEGKFTRVIIDFPAGDRS